MERLTKTYQDGTRAAADDLPCGENSWDYKGLLLEKLGQLEDLEEQGRLIQLPCKLGDHIYDIDFGVVMPSLVTGISVGEMYNDDEDDESELCEGEIVIHYDSSAGITGTTPASEIGVSVFLTWEEAEKALEEREASE